MKTKLIAAVFAAIGIVHVVLPYHVEFTGYVFLLLAVGTLMYHVLRRRNLRKLAAALLAAMLLCSGVLTGAVLMIGGYAKGSAKPQGNYLIVLGAQTHGNVPSRTLRERLDRAADFMDEHPGIPVILSGGKGTDEIKPEAEVMYHYLASKGADMTRVYREEKSTNTRENLLFSTQLACEQGIDTEKVIILSSEYHLARASYIAKQLGLSVTTVPSRTMAPFLKWNYYIRESFSFVKAFAQG